MGFVKRRVSGDYFGGSSLIVPGQGVYSIKKYNNFVGKSGIKKDNYDDIPLPTPTPTPTMTNAPTMTPTPTPTPTPSGLPECKCYNFIYSSNSRLDNCTAEYIDCNEKIIEIMVLDGDNYVCLTDQKSFILSPGCNGSIIEVVDNGVCDKSCGAPKCMNYEIINGTFERCTFGYVQCDGEKVFSDVNHGETVYVCSIDSVSVACKGVVVNTIGDCI